MNANLYWGPVLLFFGLVMLVAARHGRKRQENGGDDREKRGKALRKG